MYFTEVSSSLSGEITAGWTSPEAYKDLSWVEGLCLSQKASLVDLFKFLFSNILDSTQKRCRLKEMCEVLHTRPLWVRLWSATCVSPCACLRVCRCGNGEFCVISDYEQRFRSRVRQRFVSPGRSDGLAQNQPQQSGVGNHFHHTPTTTAADTT